MWLGSSRSSCEAQFASSVPFFAFFFFFSLQFLVCDHKNCTGVSTLHLRQGFHEKSPKTLGEQRQPLQLQRGHDSCRTGTFHRQAERPGLSVHARSPHSSGARPHPAHPFRHGLQNLFWCSLETAGNRIPAG